MILTCVTSRYLPNLRHVARLCEVDLAVVLDLAPLPHRNRDSFVTRNRIHQQATDEDHWLTVPVMRHGRSPRIFDAEINPTDRRWARKHLATLRHAYPDADRVAPGFLSAIGDAITTDTSSLLELNCAALRVILDALGRSDKMPVMQSSLVSIHRKEHRLDIAGVVCADGYLAGDVERQHINETGLDAAFADAGVDVLAAPAVPDDLPRSIVVRYSAVHAICRNGIEATRVMLDAMTAV